MRSKRACPPGMRFFTSVGSSRPALPALLNRMLPACRSFHVVAAGCAIILMHNNPSGDASPSDADIKVRRDLIRAGQLLKMELLASMVELATGALRSICRMIVRPLGKVQRCAVTGGKVIGAEACGAA